MQVQSLLLDTVQVGEHTEKQFSCDKKQGKDAHPLRKGVAVPPSEEQRSKAWLSHLYMSVLPSLCLLSGQLSGFFFHT